MSLGQFFYILMHINIIQRYTGPVKFNSLTVVRMLSHSVASMQSSNPTAVTGPLFA